MANIANNTILGNQSGGAHAPIALTTTQIKAFLSYTYSDVGAAASDHNHSGVYEPATRIFRATSRTHRTRTA